MNYLWLIAGIISEVVGTSFLKSSNGFTRPLPSIVVIAGYSASFFFLSQTLKTIPVGIAYAIWSGLGTVLVATVGVVFFRQTLDRAAVVGMALIVAGVVLMNLFSKSVAQ